MSQGLENVVAAQTCLSHVDGAQGELIIRGYPLAQLTGHLTYAETAALLWRDLAPGPQTAAEIEQALGAARVRAWQALAPCWEALAPLEPLAGLRAGLALIPTSALPHLDLVAAAQVLVPNLDRLRQGLAPVAPNPSQESMADVLLMLRGEAPEPQRVAALTAYLVTVCEHGMNASTFTARVIASTRADVQSAVIGAIGALSGPLHGGAPGPVLDMLDAIGSAENIGPWIDQALAQGERLMGFGHRIYRVRDPRADVLRDALLRWQAGHNPPRLAFAREVERVALAKLAAHKPDRPLDTNVEFYTALLLDALDFDRSQFTALFALGRMLGWCAHVYEQQHTGKLIRPQSEYIGPRP